MLVGGFEKAWTQSAMNLDRAVNDLATDGLKRRRQLKPPFVIFVSFVVFVFQRLR